MKYLVTFCYDDSLMKKQCCENIIIWDFEIEAREYTEEWIDKVNYPPLAHAEVGASGLRPSFFLPILHRQAPVFHRLGSIYR